MARSAVLPQMGEADLDLLRVFVTVVRCGGFTAARSELNVSQSSISVRMAALESRLGLRLCERGRAGFRLTAEGRLAFDAATALFRAIDEFRAELGAARGRVAGDLHVGVADATVTNPDLKLDEALAVLRRRAPDVHLHLHTLSALELELGLVDGRLHAVIGPMQRRRPELAYAPLLSERQVLYCGRRSALFNLAPHGVTDAMLAAAAFARRGYMADWTPPSGIRLRAAATTVNMEASTRLVLGGEYIAYLPAHYAEQWAARGDMRPIRPDALGYDSQFVLAVRRSGRGRPLRAFLETFAGLHGMAIPT